MEIVANIAGRGLTSIRTQGSEIDMVRGLGEIDRKYPFISPGFVDIQVNGFAGVDFSDPELTAEKAYSVLPAIWKTGVTSFCATLVTNTIDALERNFRVLQEARHKYPQFASTMPCYHLEGPYMSPGKAHGAHDPKLMRSPDWDEFLRLQEAAEGNIAIVTIAPEIPGACEFIQRANGSGIIVAIGHTDGTPSEIHNAINAGARMSTHLGNGCATYMHRHENPIWPQLASNQLSASIICDGFHLPPDLVRTIYKAKGIDNCILITDAVHVATLSPGPYKLANMKIRLLANGKVITDDGNSMAGSSLGMDRAISIFCEYSGAPLEEALQAATKNPAKLLGHQQICSEIAPGQPANMLIFQVAKNVLNIESVLIQGEQVYHF